MRKIVLMFLLLMGLLVPSFIASLKAQEATPHLIPHRIVSMNLCVDELLLRITDTSRIAAVTQFSGNPNASTVFEAAQEIPKIKGEIEEVLSFQPDLVIAGIFSNAQTIDFLRRLDVPILMLDVAENFESIYENIRILGEHIGEAKKAESLVEQMKSELYQIRLQSSDQTDRALFYQGGGNVPGANTFQDAIFQQVGLTNIAAEVGIEGHAHFPLERVIAEQPDLLIFWDQYQKNSSVGKQMLSHPAIRRGLPDVKTITLPSKLLNCGSPATVDAVKFLHKELERVQA